MLVSAYRRTAMAPTAKPTRHEWNFLAAQIVQGRSVVPVAIAACSECGLLRTAVAVVQHDSKVELGGDCPGR